MKSSPKDNNNKGEDDECVEMTKMINTSMEIFINRYNQLTRMDYKSGESLTEDLSEINTLCAEINTTMTDIENKTKIVKAIINSCPLKHNNLIESIEYKTAAYFRLKEKFISLHKEINAYFSSLSIDQLHQQYNKVELQRDLEQYNMNELMLEEEKLVKIKEYLDVNERDQSIKCSKEEMQQILQVKNQIKEMLGIIKVQIDHTTEQLTSIEDNVVESCNNIQKGNSELKQAALKENKTKQMKYPLIFGAIFGALGTIVPGIGNAIGVAVGGGIGYGLAKLEKKAIEKIDKK